MRTLGGLAEENKEERVAQGGSRAWPWQLASALPAACLASSHTTVCVPAIAQDATGIVGPLEANHTPVCCSA
jgi:hypothetical protein